MLEQAQDKPQNNLGFGLNFPFMYIHAKLRPLWIIIINK